MRARSPTSATLLKKLGAFVCNQRIGLSLSPDELASRAGLERQDIETLEVGKYDPRATELAAIAAALDMSVGQLLTRAAPAHRSGRRISPLAYATVAATLISGAVDEDSALRWEPKDSDELIEAVHRPLRAFAAEAATRRTNAPELINAYPGVQAAEIANGLLRRTRSRKGPVRLWVPEQARTAAIELLARRLVEDLGLHATSCAEAVNAMLQAYHNVEPVLVAADRLAASAGLRGTLAETITTAVASAAGAP
jgi:DNA-binding XRE family transcriptional regulator